MPSFSENKSKISAPEGVFFNPNMEFCRDFCSLAVGSIAGKLSVCDSFCASGVRGIRYKKENKNVGNVLFVDRSKKAVDSAKKNCKSNKVSGCSFFAEDLRKVLLDPRNEFSFLEIDPFGSPAPFIYDSCRHFSETKRSYLSITATDTAVLCGAEHKACIKNYGAIPLHNELCHEAGARILAGFVQRNAAQFNLCATPMFCMSDQHYFKIIFELEQDAKKAFEAVSAQGHVLYEEKKIEHRILQKPFSDKKGQYEIVSGPMYLGELHSEGFLKKMQKENKRREYAQKAKIEKMISLMLGENGLPQFYYDLHRLADRYNFSPPGMEKAIEKLKEQGFRACRTHFRPTAIKTDAKVKDVLKAVKEQDPSDFYPAKVLKQGR